VVIACYFIGSESNYKAGEFETLKRQLWMLSVDVGEGASDRTKKLALKIANTWLRYL